MPQKEAYHSFVNCPNLGSIWKKILISQSLTAINDRQQNHQTTDTTINNCQTDTLTTNFLESEYQASGA
jgi:hypothetical protein